MSNSLRKFVTKTLHNNRIGFGDLRRLERDILPVGITTPFEAEVLIALDRTIRRADRRWSDYLISAVKEFVVWGTHPAGCVDRATADWLVAALVCGHPKTARAITNAIVREAQQVDDALMTSPPRSVKASRARQVLEVS
jgi:hypothetical protein